MIFWIEIKISNIFKGKNLEISGSQKWKGGRLSLIIREINIM